MDEFIYVKTLVSRTLDDGVHIDTLYLYVVLSTYIDREQIVACTTVEVVLQLVAK